MYKFRGTFLNLFAIIIILILVNLVTTQNFSPCPDVLTYEETGSEQDRWYGEIKLVTSTTLSGIWLRIELDQPAELLGNWFADTTTDDNTVFFIKNRNYQLQNDRPLPIRFFVKYNWKGPVPRIKNIILNGRMICSSRIAENIVSTTSTVSPQPFISVKKTEKPKETVNNIRNNKSLSNNKPSLRIEEESCGTIKTSGLPLITYGQNTSDGEWPWHVAIYRNKGITFQYVCGGSLISLNHVLTAAYCIVQPKTAEPYDSDLFIIYLGRHSLFRLSPNTQNNGVKKISIHPKFNPTRLYDNIAVLHLDSPVRITDFVRPVCLWDGDVNLNNVIGKLGTIVGWGFDEHAAVTENLMQATMPIVTTATCIFSNQEFFSVFTSPTTYCAGFKNGTSACVGDSGGGMVFPKNNSNGQGTVWQLRGIVSLTAAAKTKIVCDVSSYVIFTDVAKYLDWIQTVIQS